MQNFTGNIGRTVTNRIGGAVAAIGAGIATGNQSRKY